MDKQTLYGVWRPGIGWLRGQDVFADPSLDKAQQVARLIGRGASVRYIDTSIVDFEQLYLEQERTTLWHTFKIYLTSKTSR